jgi:diguanylate cyclase (GGDEF)-like protein
VLWQQTKHFLIGDEQDFELENRIFNLLLVLGFIISFLSAVINHYLELSYIMEILGLVLSAVIFWCWYLSRIRRLFGISTFLVVFFVIFIITPGAWFFNSGSNGGAQYFLLFWGILVCSVYHDRRRYSWLAILFMVIGVLMYIEYSYPYMISIYSTKTARTIDVYASIISAMLVSISVFIIYANSYRAEHERVKEYAKHFERAAITDGLTNIYNHRYLQKRLAEEVNKAERYQLNLSVIMIDIDYFKKLNDTFGHPTGDSVLEQLANILSSNIRASDIVGRYGGEEFLIICPGTNKEGAMTIAEKERAMVESTLFGKSEQIRITISCGITTWNEENSSEIIEEADRALYAAKKSGRNRVEIYSKLLAVHI